MTRANHDIAFIWVQILVWDTRKCKCALRIMSLLLLKGSDVGADVGIRPSSM